MVFFQRFICLPKTNESPPVSIGCSDWDVVNQSNGTQQDRILRSWNFYDATSGLWWRQIFGLIPSIPNKSACPGLKRIFRTVLGDKRVTSGSESVRYFETNRVNPINLYVFENISSRWIQGYQTLRDSTKLKFWFCHFRFSLNSLFRRTSHYPNIYVFPNLY